MESKKLTYIQFRKENEEWLRENFEDSEKFFRDYKKEEPFINYEVFCLACWKEYLKESKVKAPIMVNGKIMWGYHIANFVQEYANKIIDTNKENNIEIQRMMDYGELYKTSYLIYTSMLGVESAYFQKMYKAIKKTELYKNSSNENKKKFSDEILKKIDVININEGLTKRNIELEKREGKKKQLIKNFINFYNDNEQRFLKVEICFDNFKKDYPEIKNDSYASFKKLIYKYKFSLKKVYRE